MYTCPTATGSSYGSPVRPSNSRALPWSSMTFTPSVFGLLERIASRISFSRAAPHTGAPPRAGPPRAGGRRRRHVDRPRVALAVVGEPHLGRVPEVRLEDLAQVHPGRDAERV